MEIWVKVKCFDYEVSNFGKVRNIKTGRIMKLDKNKNGYFHLSLYKKGKAKDFRVHRLVAEAFIPNPNNLPIINHKDENKSNNFVDNLEWCSYKYNANYGSSRQKLSNSLKGRPKSEEHKRKLREVNLGKHLSEETRHKISLATMGEKNGFYGKHHTEQTRQKFREKIITKETRQKISKTMKNLWRKKKKIYE